MTSVVIDQTLEFSFPDNWLYSVYENTSTRVEIQRRINSICCVDLLLIDPENNNMFIIEAKDYAAPLDQDKTWTRINNELPDLLARKFVHTIAGLASAQICRNDELRSFYQALLDSEVKKYLVSFVEFGVLRNRQVTPGKPLIVNLHHRLKSLLYTVCCKKILCDMSTVPPNYGWRVGRIPN